MSMLLIVSQIAVVLSTNCYSITQGGGGSYGAYEAGVFSGLVNNLPAAEVNYYAVVGISAGSLNSMGIAQYPQGSEIAAADFLITTYLSLNGSSSIFKEFPGGVVDGLLFHSGIYDTSPEKNLIQTKLSGPTQRKITMGTTNMDTGLYDRYNETIGLQGLVEATMCSSAIPMLFESQNFNGWTYNDGGCYNMMDPQTAVERCFEVTSNQNEIFVDMLSCFRHILVPEGSKMKTPDVLLRAFEISGYSKTQKSISDAMNAFPDVNFRYYVQPSEATPFYDALDFNKTFLQGLINTGISDAKNAISNGTNMRDMFKGWTPYLDTIYP